MQAIMEKLCAAKQVWDKFWRREDKKYFADPVAYKRKMDRNFARIPITLLVGMLVWIGWELLK
jgi:hypothetical protein